LELIKDYDLEIHYNPSKANLVAIALSQKGQVHAAIVTQLPDELAEDFERLNLGIVAHTKGITIELEPTLEQEIRKGQIGDAKIQEIKDLITEGRGPDFTEDEQGTIWFKNRICVPDIESLHETILKEAHDLVYSIHPGSTKMYQDLKQKYWWYGLKKDVASHVALCDVCQRVKAEHQRPAGLLHPLNIPEWKWEEVAYQLELPDHLADVHDVFHVSQLKKCLRVPEEQLPLEDLSVQDDLTYAEYPIKILNTLTRITRNKVIKMCKVQWSHHGEDEATWEREEELHIDFPHLFPRSSKISRTRLFVRG
jgi:hypothetical protein